MPLEDKLYLKAPGYRNELEVVNINVLNSRQDAWSTSVNATKLDEVGC